MGPVSLRGISIPVINWKQAPKFQFIPKLYNVIRSLIAWDELYGDCNRKVAWADHYQHFTAIISNLSSLRRECGMRTLKAPLGCQVFLPSSVREFSFSFPLCLPLLINKETALFWLRGFVFYDSLVVWNWHRVLFTSLQWNGFNETQLGWGQAVRRSKASGEDKGLLSPRAASILQGQPWRRFPRGSSCSFNSCLNLKPICFGAANKVLCF